MNWVVIKFGGTSVSGLSCWQNITTIARQHVRNGTKLVMVCSAPQRVSNYLEALLKEAPNGKHEKILENIRAIYQTLADELGLKLDPHVGDDFAQLNQLILGISLVNEATPRVMAQVMAFGELMLTRLAVAYLQQNSINSAWVDARQLLQTTPQFPRGDRRNYLAGACYYDNDKALQQTLNAQKADVIVTQGFIARNAENETVLLGRGGSDVSAAYLAAKLNAKRCEIWTDVPGIYSANPHLIPEARMLKKLSYDETQEIASMGAKVLHPRTIAPVKKHHIPLYVKYTQQPEREGTLISLPSTRTPAQIKSILTKHDILLISLDAINMWQAVGFLSQIFECFRQHNLSVDLISTSEATVTVSLDTKANLIEGRVIETLLADLNQFAKARTIGPCAAISLVGHQIRAILHKLSDIFSVFESQHVYLVSQAANDLNLTFVVDEDQAERLALKLHALLIEQATDSLFLGNSWQQDFGTQAPSPTQWWEKRRDELLKLAKQETLAYVYDEGTLRHQTSQLLNCQALDYVYYSMKANNRPEILKLFHQLGLGFECVSMGEVKRVLELFPDINRQLILYTPNFAPRDEYVEALTLGVYVTVDNEYVLTHWSDSLANHSIFLRVDPGHGIGHHRYVSTGGTNSKFGITIEALKKMAPQLQQSNINVVGLHAHYGSGILTPNAWQQLATTLASLVELFPNVTTIDLGGGLGVVEKTGQKPLDMQALSDSLAPIKRAHPQLTLCMEPGRYLVANAGVLLATVTQLKQKGDIHYVGINTGMNSLIRPALYGSYHNIVNLTRLDKPRDFRANIVGPICESGDTLGYSRLIAKPKEGDVLLIANTGAYGHAMSSHYNLRDPAQEFFLVR